jgi:hypothetical protein
MSVEAFTPLQAADILAYEILNVHTKIDARKPVQKLRWPYKQLELIPGELKIRTPKGLDELERGLADFSETDLQLLEWGAKRKSVSQ